MSNSRPCCTAFLFAASLLACQGETAENAGTIVEQAIEASRAELTEDSASASTPGWLWSQVGRSPRHTSFNPYETYLTPDIVAHSSYLTIRPALVGIPRQLDNVLDVEEQRLVRAHLASFRNVSS